MSGEEVDGLRSLRDDLDDDDDLYEDEDEEYFDCGLMPDGRCSKAGSEECDWECPYSR